MFANWFGLRCLTRMCPCLPNRDGWQCAICGEQKGLWPHIADRRSDLRIKATAAVTEWLDEDEGFSLRRERMAEDLGEHGHTWIAEAALVVADALANEAPATPGEED